MKEIVLFIMLTNPATGDREFAAFPFQLSELSMAQCQEIGELQTREYLKRKNVAISDHRWEGTFSCVVMGRSTVKIKYYGGFIDERTVLF